MTRIFRSFALLYITALGLALPLQAETVLKKDVAKIYAEICANCHGKNLEGAQAPSMLDDVWSHGGDDASLAALISDGDLEKGMPAFHSLMTEGDIRTMVIYIREQRANYSRKRVTKTAPEGIITAGGERFRIETVADKLATPWSIGFFPDGRMIFTEKPGRVRVVENGQLLPALKGTPEVRDAGQGGLLEVAVHPQYAENGWIYLAYSDPAKDEAGKEVSLTTLVRGRIKDGTWTDQQTIWKAPLEFYRPGGGVHYGCRIAFDGQG